MATDARRVLPVNVGGVRKFEYHGLADEARAATIPRPVFLDFARTN
jgi:hypothetical protein